MRTNIVHGSETVFSNARDDKPWRDFSCGARDGNFDRAGNFPKGWVLAQGDAKAPERMAFRREGWGEQLGNRGGGCSCCRGEQLPEKATA
jgi:hypothetical protein